MALLRVVWFAVLFTVAVSDIVNPELYLWPIPQSVQCSGDIYAISVNFAFQGAGPGGELSTLTGAFERYRKFISPSTLKAPAVDTNVTTLEGLMVDVLSADETLGLETDESCKSCDIAVICLIVVYADTIEFSENTAMLKAPTVYGALRGRDTLLLAIQLGWASIALQFNWLSCICCRY